MSKAGQAGRPPRAATPRFVPGAPLPSWLEAIAPYGIFTTDLDLRITTWNEWLANASGLSADAVVGRLLLDVYPDLTARRVIERYGRALAGEISVLSTALHQYLLPFPVTAPSSTVPHMLQSARIAPLVEQETVVGTITIIEDVTQREFQSAILRRQQELDQLLSSALALLLQSHAPTEEMPKIFAMMNPALGLDAYASYLLSPDELKLVLNASGGIPPGVPEALQTLSLDGADRAGLHTSANPAERDIAGHQQALRRLGIRGCYTFPMEVAGRVIGLLVFASYARDVIVPGDVSVLERIARYLAIAIDRTVREKTVVDASRAKDDFLAALSHELRTPLHPILLVASDGAANENFPGEARDSFRLIETNVRLEARLIDDLLDLTRIEHGKLGLEIQALNVHAMLNDAITTVRSDVAEHKLKLHVDLRAKSLEIRGDAGRLQQVIWNVIKNAVKFTPAGGDIWVSTSVDDAQNEVVIEVRDNGIGMSPDELTRIFGAFIQGDHAPRGRSHRFGGLGLGLAISQKLVLLHGGRIEARSEGKGRGATFTVCLPLSIEQTNAPISVPPSRKDPASRPLSSAQNGKRILLIEDHEQTRSSLSVLLKRRGYVVIGVGSVQAALDEAARAPFDVVVSDIGLPDGDGIELMKRLRELHGLRGIALTGYGMVEDRANSSDAGFFAHLTKPINVQLLEQTLDNAFSEKSN